MSDNTKECPACGEHNDPDETGCLAGTYQYDCSCGEVYHKLAPGAPLPWDDPAVEQHDVDRRIIGFPILDDVVMEGFTPDEIVLIRL